MKAKLQEEMKLAMKARDKVRLDTIRSILTAFQYEEMQKETETLPDDVALAVLQRELKKRKEELEFAEQAKRQDIIEKLNAEMATIESFLPKQMSAEEIEKFVVDLKSKNPGINMGVVMKSLQESHPGQYNGKTASEIVRKVLG